MKRLILAVMAITLMAAPMANAQKVNKAAIVAKLDKADADSKDAKKGSKALFDRKVARELLEGRATPPQHIGFKFFNVYGPNEYHKGGQKSVIAHIFPVVKADEEVKLFKSYHPDYKDGEQLRDFVWVGDIVSVILWALENKNISGLYNIGTGKARSFYDLAKATWNALGKQEKIGFKDMPVELRGKYQYFTEADLTKLRLAGYTKPMTSLEDGVREYVQNYLNKEDMYR